MVTDLCLNYFHRIIKISHCSHSTPLQLIICIAVKKYSFTPGTHVLSEINWDYNKDK